MNITTLKKSEEAFLRRYPGGFAHPDIQEIAKKHKLDKMTRLVQEQFAPDNFELPERVVAAYMKVVGQSSMVSVFEKAKFRDLVKVLSETEKDMLSHGIYESLHGNRAAGFGLMAGVLRPYQLAKWPLLTVVGYYYRPDEEVFVKPTTVKNVIAYFELEGLKYTSTPDYGFYSAWRDALREMKAVVSDPGLKVENAGFCGFLMMVMQGLETR